MKQAILISISLIISSVLTLNFSTFTHPIIILTLPGLLFGLALTLPATLTSVQNHLRQFKILLIYPCISFLCFGLFFILQMLTPSLSDKTPYIIIGVISGLLTAITFDTQFGLRNKNIGLIIITGLSIAAVLIGDQLFPYPHDKELNIGKLIAIWEITVGVGILKTKKNAL